MGKWVVAVNDLSDREYRAIYDEVREGRTLRDLVAVLEPLGCGWSIAAWSKYARGELGLNRAARNALRAYAGLPELPPSPAEVVAASPVRRVMVASKVPDTAILVGQEVEQVELRRNGKKRDSESPPDVLVTSVTSPRRRFLPRIGITISKTVGEPLRAAREAAGLTWDEVGELAREAIEARSMELSKGVE